MKRFGLLVVCAGISGLWPAAIEATCVDTCICKECFQILSGGLPRKYRTVNDENLCQTWRHDIDYNTTCGGSRMVEVRQVDFNTPYCTTWGTSSRRTAHSCYQDKEGHSPVEMLACDYCQYSQD